ncbi:Probable succinyl-diaminopimelate desuccinylase [Geodia barretti]|uniref:Probable succinyl-diaminopimelate desuccinylase n=1 Tax=Geodia barretti TaxID=519541 RepID=A0AA35TUQ5_GEOBA|nr:Probable succinyl-diaminopimelate desuccinylase [Geodia barretti]
MPTLEELFTQVDAQRDEIIALEQTLVRIPSVNTGFMPTGDETPVCEYIRDWLAEDGIESEILGRTPERGNIIARIEGSNSDAGLMFMSHTDVVPVEEEEKWRFPPFSATIADGRIYGRGASDCKGLLTAQLYAMRLLIRNGIQLEDSLIFCSGEKGRLQVEIEVKGVSSHASVPWQGTNALYTLQRVLQRIEAYEPERDTSTSLFDHLSVFAIEHKPSAANVDEIIAEIEPENPRFASMMRALSRMTLTPTMISGGIKSNSVPETIRLTCDVRTLPHQSDDYLREQLDSILEGIPNTTYEIDYMAVPNSSSFDTDLGRSVQRATAAALGIDDIQWVPAISTGFTDSRFTRPLGTVTYGFNGSHPDDDPMLSRAHGTDESIGISSLISGTKIMLALAIDVLNGKSD